MARQVIDELLQDIVEEIEVSASSKTAANKIVFEYGLGIFINNPEEDIYYSSKVA